jgi:hypothetical protein
MGWDPARTQRRRWRTAGGEGDGCRERLEAAPKIVSRASFGGGDRGVPVRTVPLLGRGDLKWAGTPPARSVVAGAQRGERGPVGESDSKRPAKSSHVPLSAAVTAVVLVRTGPSLGLDALKRDRASPLRVRHWLSVTEEERIRVPGRAVPLTVFKLAAFHRSGISPAP